MSILKPWTRPAHALAVVGGAVAGSEAAAIAARRGALVVVLEQGDRPYGKIEDGLPKWHEKLRDQEYAKIDENLAQPNVLFVPRTRVGADVPFALLEKELGFNAVLLANGAWRDRPLPIEGVDAYVDRGLVYQNPFVHWFNHEHEPSYDGPTYDIPNKVIVVGGGLASIDVVKIVNLSLYANALRARGFEVDVIEMEIKGIPAVVEKHGLTVEELGIEGATLFYRRSMQDMPLASADDDSPAKLAKIQAARVKIMERVMRKYCVHFEGHSAPSGAITEDGRLVGLVFQRTEIEGGRVRTVPGSDFEARAPLVLSSIGSVPQPIPGVPMKGELYDYDDWDKGSVHDHARVFGLGNVLTGKGNIRDSRLNAVHVAEYVLGERLELDVPDPGGPLEPRGVRADAENVVDAALDATPRSPDRLNAIARWVEGRWNEVGYGGDYTAWAAEMAPPPVR